MVPYFILSAFNEPGSGKILIAINVQEVCVGGLMEVETIVNDVAPGIAPAANTSESHKFLDQGVDNLLQRAVRRTAGGSGSRHRTVA